jgi:hypothetical protein
MLVINIECFLRSCHVPTLGGLSEFTLSASTRQNDVEGVGSEQPFSVDGKK